MQHANFIKLTLAVGIGIIIGALGFAAIMNVRYKSDEIIVEPNPSDAKRVEIRGTIGCQPPCPTGMYCTTECRATLYKEKSATYYSLKTDMNVLEKQGVVNVIGTLDASQATDAFGGTITVESVK